MKIISKLIELKDRVSPMYYEIYDYQDVMGEKIIYLKNSLHNPEGFQGFLHLYMRTIIILKMEEQFYEYSRSNGNGYARDRTPPIPCQIIWTERKKELWVIFLVKRRCCSDWREKDEQERLTSGVDRSWMIWMDLQ